MDSDKLQRTIGLVSATSIGLGAMLGAGIFVFPGLAGGNAGFAAIFSFLIGGMIALLAAVCTAELATAMPQSGGGYFFISRSFGSFWGTLTGISQWVGLVFACAFYLISFGEYALTLLEEANITWNLGTRVLSFVFTLILLIVNLIGTKKVGRFQNLMVISLTILLVLIFSYGLIDFFGLEDQPVAFSAIAPNGVPSIFTTTALIFTSYLGFVQIANIGAEIKQPDKNLPRSLIASVFFAMTLYTFIMLVCVLTFPQAQLKKFGETATIEVARTMLGSWGAIVVLFAGLLATLSSANASMISASRGVFALSSDKLISQKASKINQRFGTPHIALILVTVPIAVMLLKNQLEVFAEVASSLHLLIYAGICLSVLKLRATKPIWYIPTFRMPAAKFVAGLGAASCLVLVGFMQKTSILISLGVVLIAIAYYFLNVKRRNIQLLTPEPPHLDKKILNSSIMIPVDIAQDEKNISRSVLEAIPITKLLLLGFKEIPEQSESKQSEEEFGKEGEKKLETIQDQLNKADVNFDSELIFSKDILPQIKQIIEDEQLQFILTLKDSSDFNQIVIPIFDLSQINKKLSTLVYNFHSNKPTKIKIVLFPEVSDESSNEGQLRQAMENQLSLLNIDTPDYEVYDQEDASLEESIQQISKKEDLVIWSEAGPSDREIFLGSILENGSLEMPSPTIFIFNEKEVDSDSE